MTKIQLDDIACGTVSNLLSSNHYVQVVVCVPVVFFGGAHTSLYLESSGYIIVTDVTGLPLVSEVSQSHRIRFQQAPAELS